jgi:glyoxylase-like metal-dependent hydrolase (beta-lactamase superfamily II)
LRRIIATVTPVLVADLLAEGERMPLYVHVIDHPDARVLVDTGMTELHPAVADLDPFLRPLSEQDFDLAGIDIVVNTHLHFDHCGGNHLFAARPDLRPASGARRRSQRGRLHDSRVGRGARRAVRAGRRRA